MPILNDGVVAGPTPLIPRPSYMTVSDADDYFSARLFSDVWNNASPQQKLAALVTSTRAIDLLNFVGVKAVGDQPLQFPRARPYPTLDFLPVAAPVWQAQPPPGGWRPGPDGSCSVGPWPPGTVSPPLPVPTEILIACCEEAIVRLDGVDVEIEIDGIGVTTDTYAGVRETYDSGIVFEGTRAGIMSHVAWNHLIPWLADGQSIYLSRV